MIRAIVRSSLRFRLLVVGIAVGVMIARGSSCAMPVDVLPEFSPPYRDPDRGARASAEEVEQLITVPLEADPERRPGRGRDPFRVGTRPVVDRAGVQAGPTSTARGSSSRSA